MLYPIARTPDRATLGLADSDALPFIGIDRWHAYELSWLDLRGKPVVATMTLSVPADTPHLVESTSLKLYLNAFTAGRFEDPAAVRARIADDLSPAACAAGSGVALVPASTGDCPPAEPDGL